MFTYHPPVSIFLLVVCGYHSQSGVVYGIVLPTLLLMVLHHVITSMLDHGIWEPIPLRKWVIHGYTWLPQEVIEHLHIRSGKLTQLWKITILTGH